MGASQKMNGRPVHIVYDGWSLIYARNDPAALHTLELLAHCPEKFLPFLALPRQLDSDLPIPDRVQILELPTPDTPEGRLRWEQRNLGRLVRQVNAQLLHLTTRTPALIGAPRTVISPVTDPLDKRGRNTALAARLREALSFSALPQAQAIFWPEDLPIQDKKIRTILLPPIVAPDFNPVDLVDFSAFTHLSLPETYLLYHGPQDHDSLQRLLAVWSWAAGSIGELYPLVVLGITRPDVREVFQALAHDERLDHTLVLLPEIPLQVIPSVYRGCTGLIHFGEVSAWGGSLRYALACAKPVIADETLASDALVGAAGYLFKHGSPREMGAALLTVAVNEDVAADLHQSALQQITTWQTDQFRERIEQAYTAILENV
jgi:glycosyltransferase involved in cell wall biosynthesis